MSKTLEDFNNIDHDAVMAAMRARGLELSWEYPGVVAIHVTETVQLWTGLHSYAYGDVSILRGDRWEPHPGPEGYYDVDIEEFETDPEVIAQAWARYVEEYRAGSVS